jgi:hypothetical protein
MIHGFLLEGMVTAKSMTYFFVLSYFWLAWSLLDSSSEFQLEFESGTEHLDSKYFHCLLIYRGVPILVSNRVLYAEYLCLFPIPV